MNQDWCDRCWLKCSFLLLMKWLPLSSFFQAFSVWTSNGSSGDVAVVWRPRRDKKRWHRESFANTASTNITTCLRPKTQNLRKPGEKRVTSTSVWKIETTWVQGERNLSSAKTTCDKPTNYTSRSSPRNLRCMAHLMRLPKLILEGLNWIIHSEFSQNVCGIFCSANKWINLCII